MAVFRYAAPPSWTEVIANATFGTTADGGEVTGTLEFDNSSASAGFRGILLELELALTSLAVPSTGIRGVEVFLRPRGSNGSTFDDRASSQRGFILCANGTSAKQASIIVPIRPNLYRVSLINRLGTAFVSGTNSLKARTAAFADV